jgi:signal transduction histidine kinase
MTGPNAVLSRCVGRIHSSPVGSWRTELGLPLLVLAVQLGVTAATMGHQLLRHTVDPGPWEWVALTVGPVSLLARRRYPVAVLWICFAATFAPASSGLASLSLVVAFLIAVVGGRRRAAWTALVLRYVSSVWLIPMAGGNPTYSLDAALGFGGWLVVLVVAAEAVRLRSDRANQIRASRQIDRRRRESEERLYVAQDLHDVIGHNISLINVQASMGLDLIDRQPEQARAALGAIKQASKEALDELRAVLMTLRSDGTAAPRAPAPALDRLAELVDLTKSAGLDVQLEVIGDFADVPTAVQLAAYRIIQESLTNIARHAAGARATVRATCRDNTLVVEVLDDGPSHRNRPMVDGTGSGIAGMRQRAIALGGDFSAGPRQNGGFGVRALLPAKTSP